MVKKTALITGATSGIGYELCKLFAGDGYRLITVARDESRLARQADEFSAAGGEVTVMSQDLSNAEACDKIFAELQRLEIEPDVLVNNAGFGTFGQFCETDLAEETRLLQVNVVSVTRLTKLLLPAMVKRGTGKILNVGSLAGFFPGPLMAVYYASKAYVLSFSEALASELRDKGITVTVLCPGATETEFRLRAGMPNTKLVPIIKPMTAARVAEEGYKGMLKGETIVMPGVIGKGLTVASRMIPRAMMTEVSRRLQPKKS